MLLYFKEQCSAALLMTAAGMWQSCICAEEPRHWFEDWEKGREVEMHVYGVRRSSGLGVFKRKLVFEVVAKPGVPRVHVIREMEKVNTTQVRPLVLTPLTFPKLQPGICSKHYCRSVHPELHRCTMGYMHGVMWYT